MIPESTTLPRFQVVMKVNTVAATKMGNQPPLVSFVRLVPQNARSTVSNRIPIAATRHMGHFHRSRATTHHRMVVIVIVPVIPTPYVITRFEDDRNPTTRLRQAMARNQFTCGM